MPKKSKRVKKQMGGLPVAPTIMEAEAARAAERADEMRAARETLAAPRAARIQGMRPSSQRAARAAGAGTAPRVIGRAPRAAGAAGVGAPSKKSKASSKRIPVIKAPPGSIRTRPPGYEARKESEAAADRLTAQRLGRKKGGIVRENKGHGGKAGSGKNSKTAARNAATLDATSNPTRRDRVSRGGGAALRGIGFEGVF